MTFFLLLRAEWRKLRASNLVLITTILVVVIAMGWPTWCASQLFFANNDYCASHALPWPNSALGAIGLVEGLSLPITAILFAWIVGSEFGRDTWKMTLPRRASRAPFLLAKLMVGSTGFVAITMAAVVSWSILGLLLGAIIEVGAQQQEKNDAMIDLLATKQLVQVPLGAYQLRPTTDSIHIQSSPLPFPQEDTVSVALGAGIQARIPLAVAADTTGTLPAIKRKNTPRKLYSSQDQTVRMAAVVQAWAAVQAFHPWHSKRPKASEEALANGLQYSAQNPSISTALQILLQPLQDGHAMAYHPADVALRPLPWTIEPVGNDLIITEIATFGATKAKVGDRITQWNGVPIQQVWDKLIQSSAGGTVAARRWVATLDSEFQRGPQDQPVEITVESPEGIIQTLTLRYGQAAGNRTQKQGKALRRLAADTWYVDLSRLTDGNWDTALKKLAKAENIVFDLRQYPRSLSPSFLQHLTTTPLISDTFSIPVWKAPGQIAGWSEQQWHLEPRSPYLKAKRAFLVDTLSISYVESLLGVVERHDLGLIVGRTSCGSNGNVVTQRLVGSSKVRWTGMEVYGPDGKSRNGVGIQPTHPATRSRAGILAGRDEILETAVELLKKP